jgi:hypothetical protein
VTLDRAWRAAVLALLAAGCASAPVPEAAMYEPVEMEPRGTPPPAPLIESPPIEPVEPPAAPPQPSVAIAPPTTVQPPATRPSPVPAPATTPTTPPAPAATPPAPPPAETEDTQVIGLLSDLSRYSTMTQDDLRREVGNAAQVLSRQRTDANRVRLAVLYTLARTSPQDDQRALQLFDTVTKASGPPSSIRNLATALQAQVSERLRTAREEQQKSEQAVRKLDQMLELERALLRDRVRSGGGGGGGGGGGSAGGH